jgi:hypothetical protein
MSARGFRPVGWVAAVAGAAIGCYMLSLNVAAERAELASLERRIVSTQQSIRTLQTELGTRGRLTQLEQWNSEVLALSAPTAGQFLQSEFTLARLDVRERGSRPSGQVPDGIGGNRAVTAGFFHARAANGFGGYARCFTLRRTGAAARAQGWACHRGAAGES